MLVLMFQATFKTHLEPPEAVLQPDLENNLILSGDHGGLQQYMCFCKLQSVLHVQHEKKVLGFDVCPINSVQLSNHTGYSHVKGQVLQAEDAECLYEGLKQNKINGQFSHLLTGYVGSKSFLEKVADIIKDLRKCNPDLTYVCDPVMGDNGKMYVPPELMPVYRDVIVPLADIVTPNQFEIEQLTGMSIATQADALKAMQILHNKGPTTVVLSSTSLGAEGVLLGLASSVKNGQKECYRVEMPYLQAIFVGTGDLFASCMLAWMHKDNDLKSALEKTVSTVQAVINRTVQSAKDAAGKGNKPNVAQMELRLIQSKADIESPKITFTATKLDSPKSQSSISEQS